MPHPIHTIDDVITTLDDIIQQAEANDDSLGYFAVLYRKVTIKVKEGIAQGRFEDGERMEKLDIVFAQRYLDAYFAYKQEEPVTAAWQNAFDLSTCYWAIVLQHLLVGINAHINLDLGIAAATISTPDNIHDLKNDFDTINEILSDLVEEVENSLATIWPTLKRILQKMRKVDDFLVDFSMEIARDGAWAFAQQIVGQSPQDLERLIAKRDEKVTKKATLITKPGLIATTILGIIRLEEQGKVNDKMRQLQG